MKKGFAHPEVIIVVLLIALVAAVTYILSQNSGGNLITQTTPTPEAIIEDEMSNWESYSGNGYSFKYPKNFDSPETYKEGEYEGVSVLMLGEEQKKSGRTQTSLFDGLMIRTLIIDDGAHITAEEAANETNRAESEATESIGNEGTVSGVMETKIGNKQVFYYEAKGYGNANVYFVDLGDSILKISVLYAGSEEKVKEYLFLADQILSTFRFTNETSWQTFSANRCDDVRGISRFSVEVPSEWKIDSSVTADSSTWQSYQFSSTGTESLNINCGYGVSWDVTCDEPPGQPSISRNKANISVGGEEIDVCENTIMDNGYSVSGVINAENAEISFTAHGNNNQASIDLLHSILSKLKYAPATTAPQKIRTYTDSLNNFQIDIPYNFRIAKEKSTYPNTVLTLYKEGQIYDLIIEKWNSQSEYQGRYSYGDLVVKQRNGHFFTLLNANESREVEEIINSFKFIN